MHDLDEIARVEARYTDAGQAALGEAYSMLLERWQAGARDTETGLRLLFLAWYSVAEPTWFTGLPDDPSTHEIVAEVVGHFGGESTVEPDVLACVALMANVAPFALGRDAERWRELGGRFAESAPRLGVDLLPDHFAGRGAFGDYFAHQARVHQRSPGPI